MEQINKVELVGVVGSVRIQHFGDKQMARFTVVTYRAYNNREGAPVIETTWFRIIAWDAPQIKRGDTVHVLGRLRERRYTGADGIEQRLFEVIASSVEPVSA